MMGFEDIKNKYNLLPKPAKASIWFAFAAFMQRGVSTITTPIFTRLLTTAEYGEYSVFNSWLEVVTVFVTLKLAAGVYMRGLVKNDTDRERFTSSLLGLVTTSVMIWFLVYVLFRKQINSLLGLSTIEICCMFIMMISTVAFNFWSARQRVDFNYRNLVAVTIVTSIVKPVSGICAVLLFSENRVQARIISLAVVELCAYFGMYISQMYKGKIFFNKQYWKHALQFNLPLIPHYLSQRILSHSDRLMIGVLVGSSAAGLYSLAYSISFIMTLVNEAIGNSLNPWIYQSIKEKKLDKIGTVSYMLLLGVACANLFLIILAPEIIDIFAPSAYEQAVYVIPPLAMSVYFMFMYILFADFEFYYSKTRWIMTASIVGAILNIILNYIFISIFGYVAAAYTSLVCYIVYCIGHYYFMTIICRENLEGEKVYNLRIIISISVLFIATGFGIMMLYPYTWIRFGILGVIILLLFINRKNIIGKIEPVLGWRKVKNDRK